MSIENALTHIGNAIYSLAKAVENRDTALITREPGHEVKLASLKEVEIQEIIVKEMCMDSAGISTQFRYSCSICGEVGRNARTCQEEMRDGTHHWVEVKS